MPSWTLGVRSLCFGTHTLDSCAHMALVERVVVGPSLLPLVQRAAADASGYAKLRVGCEAYAQHAGMTPSELPPEHRHFQAVGWRPLERLRGLRAARWSDFSKISSRPPRPPAFSSSRMMTIGTTSMQRLRAPRIGRPWSINVISVELGMPVGDGATDMPSAYTQQDFAPACWYAQGRARAKLLRSSSTWRSA